MNNKERYSKDRMAKTAQAAVWMKKYIVILLIPLLMFAFAACGHDTETEENGGKVQDAELHTDNRSETDNIEEIQEDTAKMDQIYIKAGENTLTAVLEDNESAAALKELLADKPLTISASNYGGFEKVCSLGIELPRNDNQMTTQAGDICLYNGNQIVIFYDSNSWAYTRLGRVTDADASKLEKVLGGEESEVTLSLE